MSEDAKESIGGTLKKRREELGYSLKDVAERTRIRKSYIESLEENRFSSLPGEAYVTGFIKVYAGYLDLDSTPLLELLEENPTKPAPEIITHEKHPQPQKPVLSGKSGSGWGAFFVGFVIVLVIGGVLYFLLTGDNTTTPSEIKPVAKQEKIVEDKIPEPVVNIDAEKAPVAQPEQPVETAEPVVAADIQEEINKAEEPLAAIKEAGSSLRMLAIADGSLIITVDQREPQEYVLHEGLDLTWKAKEKASFEMGSAGQARFWLDGKELKLGDRKSLDLTQAP